ncbi:MAG TPA: GGDEF domain-containing protein, partial [Vicinamibacteria bacterium]|nr:GGDEF domain-containing protein [Vicinamibacteria bacterium]
MASPTEAGDEVQRRHLHALLKLARASFEATKGDSPDLSLVLEAGASVLDAERASFWRRDDEHHSLRCEHLYVRSTHRHSRDREELSLLAGPRSLEALGGPRTAPARTEDPAAAGTATLDAPVRLAGMEIGLVRYERVGRTPPGFSPDDAVVAASLADLVALSLEARHRERSEEGVVHVSLHDPLTDLPSRRLFLERVERSLRGLERRTGLVAVLSLDVDHFAQVIKTMGRSGGDEVLLAIARTIAGVLRPADLLARLGGDRFGVLIDRLDEPWEAIAVAER